MEGLAELAPQVFASMAFRYPWRVYQTQILERFAARDGSKRTFHVVAPPGSGKTMVGLEIARRIGRPAVTFSPTTTIQEQWRDKVRFFRPEGDAAGEAAILRHVSDDAADLRVLTSLTYQSLATQTQERAFLDRLGRRAWTAELVTAGRTEERAAAYLDELAASAAEDYRKGVANRARVEKRRLLASGEATLADVLHPNALSLIERIAANGTGCLIFDEAHHLLDYWAIILAELIRRVPDALVVGLTATPPATAEPGEMEHYLRLVNGIDFEVPTPAVVKSGSLAPYQDLVRITRPTETELAFLQSEHALLEAALARAFDDPRFLPYLQGRIDRTPTPAGGERTPWETLLQEEFDLAVAGVRFLLAAGRDVAGDVEVVPSMRRPPDHRDRMTLLREWGLGFLRRSKEPDDRTAFEDLKAGLRTLGWTMTEGGWRAGSSPVDRVLAYSRSKVDATVEVLAAETATMGPGLRAVVLTDFERSSATALHRLEGILDADAGGAVQAIRALVARPETNALDPIMVTGRSVLVDVDLAPRFVQESRKHVWSRDLPFHVEAHDVGDGLAMIVGTGTGWGPREYVSLVTDLFEAGVTRCLVGTRGLLSEGWDSLSLNTLVDLTTAGTYASVNQIRGRSIRLDPNVPRKVANNWDVVCLAEDLPEGRGDLDRFAGKHRQVWGLGPGGRIVKGPGHVDERILFLGDGGSGPAAPHLDPAPINDRALRRAADRDGAYDRWRVGEPYDDAELRGTVLAVPEMKLRTAKTWKRSVRGLLNVGVADGLASGLLFARLLPRVRALGEPSHRLSLAAMVLGPLLLSTPLLWRSFRAAFVERPVESSLRDVGRAVAQALRSAKLSTAGPKDVRVSPGVEGTFHVQLATPDPQAAARFADAIGEVFTPIADQRYLVTRDPASPGGWLYRPVWWLLRRFRRPIYHPVPTAFGRKRELAEAFAAAWRRWVGGGELVYTRSPEGAPILLRERARAGEGPTVRAETVDEWR